MDKEIDLQKIGDPLHDYIENIYRVPLEEYSGLLTKYQLLRLDTYFTPFHITKGCLSKKNIEKLIDLLLIKNKNLISLNLSGCLLPLSIYNKLKGFKNLKSLNLHNTINLKISRSFIEKKKNLDTQNLIFNDISNINLQLLDISNNVFLKKPFRFLTNIKSLEILSMENCKFYDFQPTDIIRFSELYNLRELDISNNEVSPKEIEEISKLKKLTLLYCNDIYIAGLELSAEEQLNYIINYIIKIKTLEYLDISLYNISLYTNHVHSSYFFDITNVKDSVVLDQIKLLITNLPKLKKLRCVLNSSYNSKTIRINDVEVILNEEVYGLKLAEEYS